MAFVINDRVKETTTTTGTGTLTLAGAASGFDSFSAGIGNANSTYYCVVLGSQWEVGIGTYTAAGSTLSRTLVISSSNADALVSFSAGTKEVFVTAPASKILVKDSNQNTVTEKLGISAVLLKDSSGNLLIRNAGDSADSVVLPQSLGTGTRNGTKFLRDDGTWQAVNRNLDGGAANSVYLPGQSINGGGA
jgi:hypothetical protein